MADADNQSQESHSTSPAPAGIKLFGTTISPTTAASPTSDDRGGDSDTAAAAEKRLQDKVIPCPRCSCTQTKFCYFNNYNVNQPRHFCKGCHRYWTAGGALRNVPVGAGRRKSKSLDQPREVDAFSMQRAVRRRRSTGDPGTSFR